MVLIGITQTTVYLMLRKYVGSLFMRHPDVLYYQVQKWKLLKTDFTIPGGELGMYMSEEVGHTS